MGQEIHHADYATISPNTLTKPQTLQHIIDSYEALSYDTTSYVANLANCSSLLWHAYHSLSTPVNWAGFYVKSTSDNELILGPFQGKVACQVINVGRGVCGTAAETKVTQLVRNVDEFPGHIACDGETKSEIVVPVVYHDEVVAVLDLDCLELNGFDEVDQEYLEKLCQLISKTCDWSKL